MKMEPYHNPVLLKESIDALVQNPDGIYVDCTFGGGGHAQEILNRLSENGKLLAFDQDADALKNQLNDKRLILIPHNFRYLNQFLRINKIEKVDGILADLGISSFQIDEPTKGFSTRFEGPLDMRMNKNQKLTAKDVINTYPEEELVRIIKEYAELNGAKGIANMIVSRRKKPLETTEELKQLFHKIPKNKQNKFFAQLFQGIRIEVNDELNALKELLTQSYEALKENGILAVISYHSLEDRLVKRFLRNGLFEGEPEKDIYGNWHKPWSKDSNKIIIPSQKEIEENPRSRSAKLRVGVKN